MPKPKRPHDPSQLAKFLADMASGEKIETLPGAVDCLAGYRFAKSDELALGGSQKVLPKDPRPAAP